MQIDLSTDDWQSTSERISRYKLHNMYIAEDKVSPTGTTYVSRPTLDPFITVGSGPIKGMWRQDGTLNGDWFIVSGAFLYRVSVGGATTLLGAIGGTGFCQFTGTDDRVVIARDGTAYTTDGISVNTVSMPDGQPVQSVCSINSYILLSVRNSQVFYWINPGDVNPDALNFASAERSPDPIVSMHVVSDEIWILGTSGPEVWQATGNADAPFQRIPARVYNEGCAFRDASITTTVKNLPALIWVTDTRAVVIAQGSPHRISNEYVEEALKKATNIRAWAFRYNRHTFYVLTADEITMVYDVDKGNWPRWDTYMKVNWDAHLGGQVGATPYAGDIVSGQIWKLVEDVSDNGLPVIREVAGGVVNTGKPEYCSDVSVRVDSGWSPEYELEPRLELRWSDDQGTTWSDYLSESLGNKGKYSTDVVFRSLGLIQRPGRVFEFRFSEKARFRLDYATMNEA